jgi:hypothetical protein
MFQNWKLTIACTFQKSHPKDYSDPNVWCRNLENFQYASEKFIEGGLFMWWRKADLGEKKISISTKLCVPV